MNNLLETPYGKDKVIQELQVQLYSELSKIWGGEIQGYGKVYRNPLRDGRQTPQAYATSRVVIPEWYNALTKDYENVYYDDNYSCVFCFLPSESDTTEDEYIYSNKTKVIFSSDLNLIYPNETQRHDSRQQVEAVQLLRELSYGNYEVGEIEERIENIFREFSVADIKNNNLNKRHVFAVNITLNYYINDKCN